MEVRITSKKDIKSKLNKIIDTWNSELSKINIDQERIKKKFDNYSKQLLSDISRTQMISQ